MVQEINVLEKRLVELFPDDSNQLKSAEGKNYIQKAMNEKITSLCCDKIGFYYEKENPILSNVSFGLHSGDRLAIIGRSGCGKSTLLKLLLNELTPQEGKIFVNGESLESMNQAEYLTKIAVVPQDIFLFDGTVLENMTLGLEHSENKLNLVKTISEIVNYSNDMKVDGFSGGERQRLAIARALLRDADIIIMDESTSALDAALSEQTVRNLDDYIKKSGSILITVSHRQKILEICNKTLELA